MRNWTAAGLGAIAAIAVVGGAGVIAAPEGPGRHGQGDQEEGGQEQGRMHGGPAPMIGALCGPKAGERLDNGLTAFESFAKFQGEQQTSWVALRDTLKGAEPRVQEICGELRGIRAGNSVDKLASVQDALTKAAAIASDVQPAYATFYGTLDDAQKRTLDDMFDLPGRMMRRG